VAGTHQAACRNGNTGTGSNLEQWLSWFGVNLDVIGQKVNTNAHGGILKNI
jgi:hypothetical protein